jgi:hypothetical protein
MLLVLCIVALALDHGNVAWEAVKASLVEPVTQLPSDPLFDASSSEAGKLLYSSALLGDYNDVLMLLESGVPPDFRDSCEFLQFRIYLAHSERSNFVKHCATCCFVPWIHGDRADTGQAWR